MKQVIIYWTLSIAILAGGAGIVCPHGECHPAALGPLGRGLITREQLVADLFDLSDGGGESDEQSTLMWSHYCDQFQGVCFALDPTHFQNGMRNGGFPVDYLTERQSLPTSLLIGGLIGVEREFQDKAAGFRTIIIITVGSALFTIFSLSMDPGFTKTRIAANIVTGTGFLGAGAIVRENGRIGGLTTAATIWLAAALSMGIGAGELIFVTISTFVVLIVLFIFPYLEKWIDQSREARSYRILSQIRTSKVQIKSKRPSTPVRCKHRSIIKPRPRTRSLGPGV